MIADDTFDKLTKELASLRIKCSKEDDAICQTLAEALHYPRYCDDQVNFPDATPANGYCVGEQVAATIAIEAARRIKDLEAALDNATEIIKTHDLCHNLHGKVDAQAFADGCAAEQMKLYGVAPDRDAKLKLEALIAGTDDDSKLNFKPMRISNNERL